jgi:hypothetical protein
MNAFPQGTRRYGRRSVRSGAPRARAVEALAGYLGSTERIQGSIELACRIVADQERHGAE